MVWVGRSLAGSLQPSGAGTETAEPAGTASLQAHLLNLYKEEENFIENFVSVQASA